ncbi:hypothetical protein JXB41_06500 [Candidatus Woesearchaeota archaeon]|nr:hypothetical protein [Candidatus Woesearchaeota archaeon]
MKKKELFLSILLICLIFISSCKQEIQPVNEEEKKETEEISNIEIPEEEETKEAEDIPVKTEENEIAEEMPEEEENKFTLTAEKTDSSVELSWSEFPGEFKSYKVIRSITNANPAYPGDTFLKTIPYQDETEYIDTDPEKGISYYAVVALGPLNEKTYSSIATVEFPNSDETPDQEITLAAEKTEQGVLLKWDKYEGDFIYYKIVHTTKHPYPKYPDDTTIKTIPYADVTEFIDINPEQGLNYYGITIVRPDRSRFTSKRVSIII